jgi:hypothetical protein
MFRWFKALPLTLALAALVLLAASCGNGSDARIRFVHAIQDESTIDVDVNGTLKFTAMSFLDVQPDQPGYTSVPSGSDTIEGFLSGTTHEAFNTAASWGAGSSYTVVGTGFSQTGTDGSNVVILSIPDNNSTPIAGDVEFRVIHASPSGPTVDVYIELNPSSVPTLPITFQGIAYTQASNYFSIAFNPNNAVNPPGYTVYVTPSGSMQPIFSEQFFPSNAGTIRTLVLTDVQGGTSMRQSFLELSDLN